MRFTTRRLLLRPFRSSDWRAVLAYQSDPRYLARSRWKRRTSRDAKAFVRMMRTKCPHRFAVVLRRTGALIGNASLRVGRAGADMGYEIAPDHWRRGYATEAVRRLLHLAQRLRIARVTAWCYDRNVASERLLWKVGFGTRRVVPRHEFFKGRWHGRREFEIDTISD